jgi:hypothetical protein
VTLPAAPRQRLRGRRQRKQALIVAMFAALLTAPTIAPPQASASPPRPADLRVVGGDRWHADNRFSLAWTSPPSSNPPLARTHYRVRDPQGNTIAASFVYRTEGGVGTLTVPKIPGVYGAEVWFENTAGEQGPVAVTSLRYDHTRPAAIELGSVSHWIGRTAFPLRVRIGYPPGTEPLAGIRGYAVAIDDSRGGIPCAAADRCTEAETAARGGIADDQLAIPALPEGTSYLHAVAVSGSGMKSATSAHATLRVDLSDPVTRLAGALPGWTNRAVSLTATATDNASGMAVGGSGQSAFTAIRVDHSTPTVTTGPSTETRVISEGVHEIEYYARDAAGNVDDGALTNGIPNHPPRTTWVRIDRSPPVIAFANSEDSRDPDLLRAWIGDGLSGADPSLGWIGVRRAHSGEGFQRLPRAPSATGELRARWDSDSYPIGDYEFQATGYDKAGNASVTTRRRNGNAMVLANPLKASTALVARFDGRPPERIVPYGRSTRLSGHLTTGIRSPLGGMPVRIVERFAAGRGPAARVSTIKTEPGGAYSVRLAPGPSREVTASFAGSPTLSRSASKPLLLEVRSALRLRASSGVAKVGGAPLVFGGRVLPPEAIPEEGKAVELQFRLPGLPWSEFRTIQTDRHGRFRYAYRFSDDDSRGARFQFRAYAPAQDDWPYEPGGSRPVIVQGR